MTDNGPHMMTTTVRSLTALPHGRQVLTSDGWMDADSAGWLALLRTSAPGLMVAVRSSPVDLDNDAGRCLVALALADRTWTADVPAQYRHIWNAACVQADEAER